MGLDYSLIEEEVLSKVGDSIKKMHNNGFCHNALHEENITLNGEIVDLEYSSEVNKELVYRDLWYSLLSFTEVFGTPLNLGPFIRTYTGKKQRIFIAGNEIEKIEEEAKAIAKGLI